MRSNIGPNTGIVHFLALTAFCFTIIVFQPPIRCAAQGSGDQTTSSKPAPAGDLSTATAGSLLDGVISLGDGRELWHPTRKELGFALADGIDSGSPASQAKLTLDRSQLLAYLNGISQYVRRAPVNAKAVVLAKYAGQTFYVSSTSANLPCKIIPERDGGALIVDQAADAIEQAVAANPLADHVVLPLKVWPATVTTASLAGIDAQIGHFVTRFNPGEVGRTQTVRRAIALIDGQVIAPGQIFSVNESVGERTAQRGFGEGHVFINGHMEMQLGGGMCQVATTLFNAALLADLKIVERHQHVRTVPYVKAGSDATVYWGAKDFKFQNNTSTPIYISYKTTATHAICDIFGKADDTRTVHIIATQRRLGERNYKGFLQRIVEANGVKAADYTAYSSYKWTPALDFSR